MTQEEPPSKKLRYAKADLRVVIGNDVSYEDNLVEYHHSIVMAKHSTFVDTMLDAPKNESTMAEICFPDISPSTWKKMILCIEDPVASRDCSVRDALDCLPFYHKYDFTQGCRLCEHVIKAYLETIVQDTIVEVDYIVSVAELSHKLNLPAEITEPTIHHLKEMFRCSRHNIKFQEYDIQDLAPLISDNLEEFGFSDFTKDDVSSPHFAKYVVQRFSDRFSRDMLTDAVTHIRVSGTLCGADGTYKKGGGAIWECDRPFMLGGEGVGTIWIENCDECWEIWCSSAINWEDHKVLWQCPNSENNPLPPKDGWKAFSSESVPRVCGTPKLEYVFGNNAS